MGAMSSWMSMRMILISAGFLSAAMGLKLSIPIAVDGVPALWSVILSWMKPPYLYIIINGIIITIVASSRFHQSHTEPAAVQSEHLISVITPPVPESFEPTSAPSNVNTTAVAEPAAEVVVSAVEDRVVDLKPVVVNGSKVDFLTEVDDLRILRAEAEDIFDESALPYNPPPSETFSLEAQLESLFPAREKPLASSRFLHRKPNRTPPEAGARALRRVARPKKQETLESTWKMITEGRHVPLTRHLKKSDTFDQHHASPAMDHDPIMPKSETFKDRSNYEAPPPPPLLRIRKEPSLGQDELNRRVEAFINKFNNDMRMQRQESLQQYKEMINRGV